MVLLNSRQRNNHPVFLRRLPSLQWEESIQLCVKVLICRQRIRRHTKRPQVLKLITHINEWPRMNWERQHVLLMLYSWLKEEERKNYKAACFSSSRPLISLLMSDSNVAFTATAAVWLLFFLLSFRTLRSKCSLLSSGATHFKGEAGKISSCILISG